MEFQEDWRSAFPSVTAATKFREAAEAYQARLSSDHAGVGRDIIDLAWASDVSLEGVPQPALDEVRSLFQRAGEAAADGEVVVARELLEDVIAYCTPADD
jgi:hypothetical protein